MKYFSGTLGRSYIVTVAYAFQGLPR